MISKELQEAVTMFKNLDMGNDEEFKRARNRILKELERLQEENSLQRWQLNSAFDNGFIHKDKIREKIREQKELMEKYRKLKEYGQVDIRLYKIQILEELLEGK